MNLVFATLEELVDESKYRCSEKEMAYFTKMKDAKKRLRNLQADSKQRSRRLKKISGKIDSGSVCTVSCDEAEVQKAQETLKEFFGLDQAEWVSLTDDEDHYPDLYVTQEEVIEHFALKALKMFFVSRVYFAKDNTTNKIQMKVALSFLDMLCFFVFYFMVRHKLQKLADHLDEFSKGRLNLEVNHWYVDTFKTDYRDYEWQELRAPEDILGVLEVESGAHRELRKLEADASVRKV